jgi:hypothetical protein
MATGAVEVVLLASEYRRLHCHHCLLVEAVDQPGVGHRLRFRMTSQ